MRWLANCLKQFSEESGFSHDQASLEDFHARVVRAAAAQEVPQLDDTGGLAGFLSPRILQDAPDLTVMKRVTVWLETRYSGTA
jgi:hypothetical protein